MAAQEVILENINHQLEFLTKRLSKIELNVEEIHDDLHQVRPEYLQKLERIKKGKQHHFETKEAFLDFLHNEI